MQRRHPTVNKMRCCPDAVKSDRLPADDQEWRQYVFQRIAWEGRRQKAEDAGYEFREHPPVEPGQ